MRESWSSFRIKAEKELPISAPMCVLCVFVLLWSVQYIPKIAHDSRFVVIFCCGALNSYYSLLLQWQWNKHRIVPVLMTQPWKLWVIAANLPRKMARSYAITKTQQKRIHFLWYVSYTTDYGIIIMMSSNGNICRVTGPLCREFMGHRWIPLTMASDAELWCFFLSAPEQTVE